MRRWAVLVRQQVDRGAVALELEGVGQVDGQLAGVLGGGFHRAASGPE
jgi:hypothetical protein